MAGIEHSRDTDAARPRVATAADPGASTPWAVATDAGPSHRHNEDRWSADVASGVFALADGMGGDNAGEIAAEIAVRTVAQGVPALRCAGLSTADALMRAVAAAHAGIVDYARTRPECLGMATTVVAAAVLPEEVVFAHLGDSRAYGWRQGALTRITHDHSLVQREIDAGHIREHLDAVLAQQRGGADAGQLHQLR